MKLFHPTYFPSIYQFALMMEDGKIEFEIFDNFQKQTYRNRCYIYGANGKQLLNVPIQKISGKKQLIKDVKIDYKSNWHSEHLKSLYSAYSSSPFFEYYIDDLKSIFENKEKFLLDLNIKIFYKIQDALELKIKFKKTSEYNTENVDYDFRYLVNAKAKLFIDFPKYTQVFDSKYNFISNLSILDLLFMEGPASVIYLDDILSLKNKV